MGGRTFRKLLMFQEVNCRMNGWQRIWVVVTVITLLSAVGLSYSIVYRYNPSEWRYRDALQTDLKSSECRPYTLANSIESLPEPKFENDGGTCWYIYTSRKFDKSRRVPYTIEVYDADKRNYRLHEFGLGVAVLSLAAVVGSGLLYLAGFTVAWIRRGFQNSG
jgi:hypothetical protein